MAFFFSSDRKSQYVDTNVENFSKEEKAARLKVELRDHIRNFGDFKFLTVDWLKMTDSLLQVANVAQMEWSFPNESIEYKQQGKKAQGTLWDQEKDEIAIRVLLEEGKLNLCLRVMVNFKETQRLDEFPVLIDQASRHFDVDIVRVLERISTFEKALGTILKFSLNHVEAMQILDVNCLISYVSGVLLKVSESGLLIAGDELEKMQESLVFNYMWALSMHMEKMDEDKIMELIVDNNIFGLMINVLSTYYLSFKAPTLQYFVQFMNLSMGSEAFVTDSRGSNEFISKEDKKCLVEMQGKFINNVILAINSRELTRNFTDFLGRYSRIA